MKISFSRIGIRPLCTVKNVFLFASNQISKSSPTAWLTETFLMVAKRWWLYYIIQFDDVDFDVYDVNNDVNNDDNNDNDEILLLLLIITYYYYYVLLLLIIIITINYDDA